MNLTPREQYIGIFTPLIFAKQSGDKLPEQVERRLAEFKAEEPALYTAIDEDIKDFPAEEFITHPFNVAEITSTGRGVGGGIIEGIKKLISDAKAALEKEPQVSN